MLVHRRDLLLVVFLIALPPVLLNGKVLYVAFIQDGQLLAEKALAALEVVPLCLKPFLGFFQCNFKRLLTGTLLGCSLSRRHCFEIDDGAAVELAETAPSSLLKTDVGVFLLKVGQPTAEALVLLGEVRQVENFRRCRLFVRSDG